MQDSLQDKHASLRRVYSTIMCTTVFYQANMLASQVLDEIKNIN